MNGSTDNGILLNNEQQWAIDTCTDLNGPSGYYAGWKKADTKDCMLYIPSI